MDPKVCRRRGKASLLEMLGRTLKLLHIEYVPTLALAPVLPRVPPRIGLTL